MQLYGNRYPTSPFLNSVPVKFVGTMLSPCFSTMCAVPHLLSLSEAKDFSKTEPENNVVALAKEAGFKTYWVSAQGKVGSFEIPISRIADSADVQHFEAKHDDFSLVSIVRNILREKSVAPRLIVVHTYGSHENTCDRVKDLVLSFPSDAAAKYGFEGVNTDRWLFGEIDGQKKGGFDLVRIVK